MAKQNSTGAGRRLALKTLGLAVTGLAMGGGGAWLKGRVDEAAAADVTIAGLEGQLGQAQAARATLDSNSALIQAQLAELRNQLTSVAGQNAQLSTALSNAQQHTVELEAQLSLARNDLGSANAKISRYQELTTLYDQLEGTGLDAAAQAGMAAVASSFATVLGRATLLDEGLAQAREALARFEQSLPSLAEAMSWLGQQVLNLRVGVYAVELTAKRTIGDMVTGLEAVFGGFAKFVLDRLPFNIGQNVRNTLGAVQSLLVSVPGVADGLTDRVLNRLSQHVGDGPQSWKTTVVAPVRDRALEPGKQLADELRTANHTFAGSLQAPVSTALQQRASLRERIAAHRSANGL